MKLSKTIGSVANVKVMAKNHILIF